MSFREGTPLSRTVSCSWLACGPSTRCLLCCTDLRSGMKILSVYFAVTGVFSLFTGWEGLLEFCLRLAIACVCFKTACDRDTRRSRLLCVAVVVLRLAGLLADLLAVEDFLVKRQGPLNSVFWNVKKILKEKETDVKSVELQRSLFISFLFVSFTLFLFDLYAAFICWSFAARVEEARRLAQGGGELSRVDRDLAVLAAEEGTRTGAQGLRCQAYMQAGQAGGEGSSSRGGRGLGRVGANVMKSQHPTLFGQARDFLPGCEVVGGSRPEAQCSYSLLPVEVNEATVKRERQKEQAGRGDDHHHQAVVGLSSRSISTTAEESVEAMGETCFPCHQHMGGIEGGRGGEEASKVVVQGVGAVEEMRQAEQEEQVTGPFDRVSSSLMDFKGVREPSRVDNRSEAGARAGGSRSKSKKEKDLPQHQPDLL